MLAFFLYGCALWVVVGLCEARASLSASFGELDVCIYNEYIICVFKLFSQNLHMYILEYIYIYIYIYIPTCVHS